jgi:hypothetical protein
MYFYNDMPYIFRHSVNIDCLYSSNNGATAVAFLLDDVTARHPSPDAPVATLGDMLQAMLVLVRPHTFGVPLHLVCRDLPDGHVAVMSTSVYFRLRFPAAFRLESGSIIKSIKIERVASNMIPDVAFTDFFAQGATFSRDKTYVLDLRPPSASAKNLSGVVVGMSRLWIFEALTLFLPLRPRGDDKAARERAKERMRRAWQPDANVTATDDMFRAEYTATSNASQPTRRPPPRWYSPTRFYGACAATIRQHTTMGCNITFSRRMILNPQTTRTTRTAVIGRHLRSHDRANAGPGQHRHLPREWTEALRRRRRKSYRRPRLHRYGDATPFSKTTPCEL